MTDHPSTTPEGRRCPECEKPLTVVVTYGPEHTPGWEAQWAHKSAECCSFACAEKNYRKSPTPAPEGGNTTTLGDTIARESMPTPTSAEGGEQRYCTHCGVGMKWLTCKACGRPTVHTPTSAEGGEGQRVAQRLTENITTLVKRWHGVGSPDHEPMALGHMLPALAADAKFLNSLLASPTPAATGGEEHEGDKRALASLSKAWPYLAGHALHIGGEFNNAHEYVRRTLALLRRQLAEAEAKRPMTHPGPYCAWCGATARPRDYFCSDSCRESWADNGGDDDQ